jgi:transcriptional regulator with XRE-family HTH domain
MMRLSRPLHNGFDPAIFKKRLWDARHARNWRIRDLARAAGLSRQLVEDLSSGAKLPTTLVLNKLAEVLGVRAEWLGGMVR